MEKLLLTPMEAAHLLSIGRTKMYSLISTGAISSIRIGASVRIPMDALQRFVEERQAADAVAS